jgi:hypothetical protein
MHLLGLLIWLQDCIVGVGNAYCFFCESALREPCLVIMLHGYWLRLHRAVRRECCILIGLRGPCTLNNAIFVNVCLKRPNEQDLTARLGLAMNCSLLPRK